VVGVIRGAAKTRKVGHAGTLDPFASGLLLILIGAATRLAEYVVGLDKQYDATVHLGVETTTHDPEGEVVSRDPGWASLDWETLDGALESFRGRIAQKPPAFSAKKIRGEPAHRKARRGEKVELEPVEIEIHSLALSRLELPEAELRVACSSGTYIRSLARDLGRALGVGGHLSALRRTAIGPFSLEASVPLSELTERGGIASRIIAPAEALAHLPGLEVGPEDATRVRQGQFLAFPPCDIPQATPVRVLSGGSLIAMAYREGDRLQPRKVLADG
jgi:tRNA pseudouridine55 synthase